MNEWMNASVDVLVDEQVDWFWIDRKMNEWVNKQLRNIHK